MFNSMNASKEFVNPVDYHKSQEDEYAVRNKFEKSATHINLNGSKPNLSSLPRYLDLGLSRKREINVGAYRKAYMLQNYKLDASLFVNSEVSLSSLQQFIYAIKNRESSYYKGSRGLYIRKIVNYFEEQEKLQPFPNITKDKLGKVPDLISSGVLTKEEILFLNEPVGLLKVRGYHIKKRGKQSIFENYTTEESLNLIKDLLSHPITKLEGKYCDKINKFYLIALKTQVRNLYKNNYSRVSKSLLGFYKDNKASMDKLFNDCNNINNVNTGVYIHTGKGKLSDEDLVFIRDNCFKLSLNQLFDRFKNKVTYKTVCNYVSYIRGIVEGKPAGSCPQFLIRKLGSLENIKSTFIPLPKYDMESNNESKDIRTEEEVITKSSPELSEVTTLNGDEYMLLVGGQVKFQTSSMEFLKGAKAAYDSLDIKDVVLVKVCELG